MVTSRVHGFLLVTFLLLLLPIVSAQSGDTKPDLTALSDADLKAVTIQFERTRCYGTCPSYRLVIHGDGHLEYEGNKYVSETGSREGQMEIEKIKALLKQFGMADFWTLSAQYNGDNCTRYCTDMPSAITEISVRGMTHRVSHYYGCAGAPKELFDLESAIDKSSGVERWTGDVSKAGPFGTTCWSGKHADDPSQKH